MNFRLVPYALLVLLLPASALAQRPLSLSSFSIEPRGEIAFPTGSFRSTLDLGRGYGFGAAIKYSVAVPFALYVGWDRFRFDGNPDDRDVRVTDQGFRLGAQLGLPQPVAGLSPFAIAGAIMTRASLSGWDPDQAGSVGGRRSNGYEVGGGVMIPVASGIWLVPEGRFRSHANAWEFTTADDLDLRVNYLAFNLGLVLRLPPWTSSAAAPPAVTHSAAASIR